MEMHSHKHFQDSGVREKPWQARVRWFGGNCAIPMAISGNPGAGGNELWPTSGKQSCELAAKNGIAGFVIFALLRVIFGPACVPN